MRIYYTTDIHGSTLCFKKFLNCGKFYSADAAIVEVKAIRKRTDRKLP